MNAVFLSYSNCFNESNVWTPPFSEKPCWEKHFSLVYVWWILSKIFENNPCKFVTNNAKGFLMDVVSRTLFMVLLHLSFNYSVWINPYLSLFVISNKFKWVIFKDFAKNSPNVYKREMLLPTRFFRKWRSLDVWRRKERKERKEVLKEIDLSQFSLKNCYIWMPE